jgi:hypothetical protein
LLNARRAYAALETAKAERGNSPKRASQIVVFCRVAARNADAVIYRQALREVRSALLSIDAWSLDLAPAMEAA